MGHEDKQQKAFHAVLCWGKEAAGYGDLMESPVFIMLTSFPGEALL